jgi:alkylation response protein AidB-like acyl-CoA dehydrogenase
VPEPSLLERVDRLIPALAGQAAAIEERREVPPQVFDALRDAGCLRMVVGREHGGEALALPAALEVIERLSSAHATVGWLIGQVALGHVVAGYLPAAARARIYAAGPDVYVAGAAAPKGRATRDGDALRVSGRWPLVSGCRHAEWLYLQCLVQDQGEPVMGPGGIPTMRCVVVPAEQARILETYRGIGLRGSGSHDVVVSGLSCPPELACDLTAAPSDDAPIMVVPVATQAGLFAAAVMLGIAAGALEAIATLAAQKRPSFSSQRLADSPLFQNVLGETSMTLAAGRALLRRQVALAETAAMPDDAWLRSVATKAAELATEVVDRAYRLGGSSSVIDGSPLERRLRDTRSLTQHATLSRDHLARLGAALAAP